MEGAVCQCECQRLSEGTIKTGAGNISVTRRVAILCALRLLDDDCLRRCELQPEVKHILEA